jgi:hypothetical protein
MTPQQPVVTIRMNERGSLCVYVRGNFISDHASHAAARTVARQLDLAETEITP